MTGEGARDRFSLPGLRHSIPTAGIVTFVAVSVPLFG